MALQRDDRYPGRFDNATSDYPQGAFKNRTSPTAKDGSYIERDWANDWAGFFGRLMALASLAPDGTVDTAQASQYYEALRRLFTQKTGDTGAAIAPLGTTAQRPLSPLFSHFRANSDTGRLEYYDAARATWLDFAQATTGTGSLIVPAGTTAERDASPGTDKLLRFNTETGQYEGYNGSEWVPVGSGATGASGDQVFVENDQVVTADYTIPSGKNAMSTGPITINSGVTVTVSDNARWVVL